MSQDLTTTAEKLVMGSLLLGLLTVTLFCICAHLLARAILQPLPLPGQSAYSRKAQRIGRSYYILTMAIMTFVFLSGLVVSFYQIFIELG